VNRIAAVTVVPAQNQAQEDEQDEGPDDDHGIRVGEFIDGLPAIG
jgi:hypothetical protein